MSKRKVSAKGRGSFLSTAQEDPPAKKSRKEEKKQSSSEVRLVKMNLQVTPERAQQLKVYAASHKKKLYEILEEALSQYLD